ncbi:zinc finger CCHC domain-containing protein 12-like [Danio rerio]|uniref:Zinc finger CCHC domain-containing protein 12-like n=2 Tax=Danio rerio TaxID=7955 RepID=A0AC58GUD5_DANRE
MDVVMQEGIKIPNAIIISGETETADNEEFLKILQKHGSIVRSVKIQDPESEFNQDVIIEFDSGSALQSLEPLLPYTYQLTSDPNITYLVRSLSSVYTQQLGGSATKSYLKGLKEIAKLSGANFEAMLSEMLTEMSAVVLPASSVSEAPDKPPITPSGQEPISGKTSPVMAQPSNEGNQEMHQTAAHVADSSVLTSPTILNPPEVQRLVVEHVVRSGEGVAQAHIPMRLRLFSGRKPRPANETDYDTWRSSVDLVLKDPAISDLHGSRKILDSLLPPAADVIKQLSADAAPSAYLQLLDSAFGTVEDGDELFAKFMNTLQDAGEKPSAYLYRLQAALNIAIKRGGVLASEADRHLLKQFCRGCWDDGLIADLRLAQKRDDPPTFAQLLLMLRTEEDKHTAKTIRMKQHLGSSKQRALMNTQRIWVCDEPKQSTDCNVLSLATEAKELKKQIATLQSQLAKLATKSEAPKKLASQTVDRKDKKSTKPSVESTMPMHYKQTDKPRPWYCFQCGEDGHIASSCDSEPNPALVAEKRKLLREKQSQWESQNNMAKAALNQSQFLLRDSQGLKH